MVAFFLEQYAFSASMVLTMAQTLPFSLSQVTQLNHVVHYVGNQTHNLSDFSVLQQHELIAAISSSLNSGISMALFVTALGTFNAPWLEVVAVSEGSMVLSYDSNLSR